jgi:carbamoylphosphate synthase large subunit
VPTASIWRGPGALRRSFGAASFIASERLYGTYKRGKPKAAAKKLGYPVLLRPSYVLGGQNMTIAFSDADTEEFMWIILERGIENPVLIDKYISGRELRWMPYTTEPTC